MYIRHVEYAGVPADSDRLTLPRLLRHAYAHLKSIGCFLHHFCRPNALRHLCPPRVLRGAIVNQSKWNWTVYRVEPVAVPRISCPTSCRLVREMTDSRAVRPHESGRASLRQCSCPNWGSTDFYCCFVNVAHRVRQCQRWIAPSENSSNVRTISLQAPRLRPYGCRRHIQSHRLSRGGVYLAP